MLSLSLDDATDDLLAVISGLDRSYSCMSINYLENRKSYILDVEDYLLSTLKDYCIKVEVTIDDE